MFGTKLPVTLCARQEDRKDIARQMTCWTKRAKGTMPKRAVKMTGRMSLSAFYLLLEAFTIKAPRACGLVLKRTTQSLTRTPDAERRVLGCALGVWAPPALDAGLVWRCELRIDGDFPPGLEKARGEPCWSLQTPTASCYRMTSPVACMVTML